MPEQAPPVPRQVCRAIHEIVQNRDIAMKFRAGDLTPLDSYELTEATRRALAERDLATLYRMGVHPVLLFHLSALLFDRTHYVKNVVPAIRGVCNPFYDYYRLRDANDPAG